MPTIAAWWTTASTPRSAASTACRSRTSAMVDGAAPTIDGSGLPMRRRVAGVEDGDVVAGARQCASVTCDR